MTDEVTHAKGEWVGIARCGRRWPGSPVDNPTCLMCIAEVDVTISEIIVQNSVRDLQEMEDQKFMDAIDAVIEKNKP